MNIVRMTVNILFASACRISSYFAAAGGLIEVYIGNPDKLSYLQS
jgi:hypothetical protein